MNHYVGTDIIEIVRIRQAIERWGERFLDRVYTPAEQKLYDRRAHSLAACFAGKEAVMKVLGTGAGRCLAGNRDPAPPQRQTLRPPPPPGTGGRR
jgi:holo-[acyl-carrier-protein] synthase